MAIVNHRILSSLMTSTIELLVVAKAIVNSENKRARGVSAPADTPRAQFSFYFRLRQTCATPSPLVLLKQIPRVHLVRHVRELVAPKVDDDHVQPALKASRSWATSEQRTPACPAWARRPTQVLPWPSRAS